MAKTILLADDSVTIQKVVELTFMDQDYKVVAVSDGTSALSKLSELRPDLVIADVHMPGENGYEVCRRAKQMHAGIPVLLLVGTFEPFDEEQARAVGADSHLKKPFDSQDLLQQVDTLVSRGQAAAAPPAAAPEPPAPPPPAPAMPTMAVPAPAPVSPQATQQATVEVPLPPPAAPAPAPPAEPASPAATSAPAPPAPAASAPAAAAAPAATAAAPAGNGSGLSDADVERIARRLAELVGDSVIREVAWEVIPDMAEVVIKERIQELESQIE